MIVPLHFRDPLVSSPSHTHTIIINPFKRIYSHSHKPTHTHTHANAQNQLHTQTLTSILRGSKETQIYHFHIFIKLGVRFSRIIAKRRKEKSYPTPHTLLNKVCERENNRPLAYIFTTSHKLTLIIYTHTHTQTHATVYHQKTT